MVIYTSKGSILLSREQIYSIAMGLVVKWKASLKLNYPLRRKKLITPLLLKTLLVIPLSFTKYIPILDIFRKM
jgi:hypothetical protein